MDLSELLRQGTEGLKPLLPWLLEQISEGFAEKAGESAFDSTLGKAKRWFRRLVGASEEGADVEKTARKLAENPDDARRLPAFEAALQDALANRPELQDELRRLIPDLERAALVVQAQAGSTVLLPGASLHDNRIQIAQAEQVHVHAASRDTSSQALREAYLRWVLRENRELPLEEFDFTAAGDQERSVPLAAVYTTLLASHADHDARRGEPGEEAVDRQQPTALELVDRFPHLVLLGEAGSGKTTFTSFLAACLAGEALGDGTFNLEQLCRPVPGEEEPRFRPWNQGIRLPIRVELRDFVKRARQEGYEIAAPASLWAYLAARLKPDGLAAVVPALEEEARAGRAVLLFDGLDEVPDADRCRAQLKDGIQYLADTLPETCRVVVTGRIYAYQQRKWQLRDFDHATLARLTPAQIEFFVDRWYEIPRYQRKFGLDGAWTRAKSLAAATHSRPELADLAQRPILLALMAGLHADRGELPEGRAQLYEEAVHLLLERWDRRHFDRDGSREIVEPSVAEVLNLPNREPIRRALEELAFEGRARQSEAGAAVDIPSREVSDRLMAIGQDQQVDPVKLLSYLEHRAGILIPRGNGLLGFPHPSLGEYLAAGHLVRTDPKHLLACCARGDPDRWREVVVLAAAKAKASVPFSFWAIVEGLLDGEPQGLREDDWGAHLAAIALVECVKEEELGQLDRGNSERVKRVREGLVALMEGGRLPPYERALAGRNLARLGDPRAEVTTLDAMQFCFVPAGPFLMGSREDDEEAWEDEKPQHEVDLPYAFWIGRFPVTVVQWAEYCRASGVEPADPDSLRGAANEPVVRVSWEEAVSFCDWLTADWRTRGFLPPGSSVRLPSEEEWEKAARGGLEQPVQPFRRAASALGELPSPPSLVVNELPGRSYPWGPEDDPGRRNGSGSGVGAVSAVGCFGAGASLYGCEELSGNVWEWTGSCWRGDYREDTAEDENLRVVRGGSYFGAPGFLRCASRSRGRSGYRGGDLGFRLVVSPFTSGL